MPGLRPSAFRIGAFPPSANLEDATGAADVIFLERNAPSDLSRNLAGGDGRDGDRRRLSPAKSCSRSFAYTGGKVADTNLFFDEQQALVGRVSDVFYSDDDWKLLLSAAGTYVFRGRRRDGGRGLRPTTSRLQDGPELTIDNNSIRLVSHRRDQYHDAPGTTASKARPSGAISTPRRAISVTAWTSGGGCADAEFRWLVRARQAG